MAKTIAKVVSITALGKLGAQAIEVASNLEEVQNVVDVSFGNMADDIEWFSKNAMRAFGLSELAVKKTASTFMAMSNGMGIARNAGKIMSMQLTALTGDMASFYNTTEETAQIALASVFTGETETLKKFGVVLTEANLKAYALSKGIKTNYQDMSQAQKVALRYNYVMEATADAQGDFVRTSVSWANQIRVLKLRWQELMGVVGNILKNVFIPMVSTLNVILQQLVLIANTIASTFGGNKLELSNQMDKFNDSVDYTAKGFEDANKAANELEKTIFGFDELNVLKDNSDNNGGNLGDIDFPLNAPYDFDELEQESKIIKSLEDVTNAINKFFENVNEKFKVAYTTLGKLGTDIANTINVSFSKIDWNNIGRAIGNGLNSIIVFFRNFYKNLKGYDIGKSISDMLNSVLYTVDWTALKEAIVGKINFLIDAFNGLVSNFDWKKLASIISYEVKNIANEIKWTDLGQSLAKGFNGAIEIISTLIDTKALKAVLDGILETIKQILANVDWYKLGKSIHDGILQIFESLKDSNVASSVAKAIRDFLDGLKPIELMVEYLKTKAHLIADAIAGFFGADHAGPILIGITTLFTFLGATIGKAFIGLIKIFASNFDKITVISLVFKEQIAKILSSSLTKAFGVDGKEFKIITDTIKITLGGIKAKFEVLGAGVDGTGKVIIGMTQKWSGVLKALFVTAKGGLTAFGWISGIVGTVGGLATAFFGLRDSIKEGVSAASTLKTVLGGIVSGASIGLMVGGPAGAGIGALIGGITSALASATVFIAQNFDTIKEVASNAWNSVKESASNALTSIKEVTSNAWASIKESASSAWNSIKEVSSGTWSYIKQSASSAWSYIKQSASNALAYVKQTASNMWNSIANSNVVKNISAVYEGIKQSASTAFGNIKQTASNTWEGIKESFASAGEWFGGLWDSFSNTASETFNNTSTLGENSSNAIKAGFSELPSYFSDSVWTPIKDSASNMWNDFNSTAYSAISKTEEEVSDKWEELTTEILEYLNKVKNSVSAALHSFSNLVSENVIKPLKEAFSQVNQMFGSFGEYINQLPEIVNQTFLNIANTIINCINNAVTNAIGMINSLINKIKEVDVFGMKPFSGMKDISIPQIPSITSRIISTEDVPKLAGGGVLTKATTVTVGEYPGASRNPEIVTPQRLMESTMEQANLGVINAIMAMASQVIKAIEDKDTDIYMDTAKVTRKITKEQDKQARNKGPSLILA